MGWMKLPDGTWITESTFEKTDPDKFIIKAAQAEVIVAPFNVPAQYTNVMYGQGGLGGLIDDVGQGLLPDSNYLGNNETATEIAAFDVGIGAGGPWGINAQPGRGPFKDQNLWSVFNLSPENWQKDGRYDANYLWRHRIDPTMTNWKNGPGGVNPFPAVSNRKADPIRQAIYSFIKIQKNQFVAAAKVKGLHNVEMVTPQTTLEMVELGINPGVASPGMVGFIPNDGQYITWAHETTTYSQQTPMNPSDPNYPPVATDKGPLQHFNEVLQLLSEVPPATTKLGSISFPKVMPAVELMDPNVNWSAKYWEGGGAGIVPPDSFDPEIHIHYPDEWGKVIPGDEGHFVGHARIFFNTPEETYRDAYCRIKKPFLEMAYQEDLGEKTGLSSPVNIKAHYNFQLNPYEGAISDSGPKTIYIADPSTGLAHTIPEPLLPNIYALIYDVSSTDEITYRYSDQGSFMPVSWWTDPKPESIMPGTPYTGLKFFKETNADSGVTSPVWTSPELNSATGEAGKLKKKVEQLLHPTNIGDYLNNFITMFEETNQNKTAWWAREATGGVKSPERLIAEKKYYITGISSNEIKTFTDEANLLKNHFPMYVDVNLPVSNGGKIGKLLYDNNLLDIIMQNVMAALWPRTIEEPHAGYGVTGDHDVVKKVSFTPHRTGDMEFGGDDNGPSSVIDNTCLFRRDAFFKKTTDKKTGANNVLNPILNEMFYESIVSLPLNPILESSDPLLDLDTAPSPPTADYQGPGNTNMQDWFMQNIPNKYYDWITGAAAEDFIKQIWTFRGQDYSPEWAGAGQENWLRIGKPVVFGKKSSNFSLKSALTWAAVRTAINKIANNRVRTVKEIYEGKEAYSEVLFYEIVKFESFNSPTSADSAVGFEGGPSAPRKPEMSFIQSIFIPNIPGGNTLNYIDTQVKFDKGYYYQIYAHTVVIGTEYLHTGGFRQLFAALGEEWYHGSAEQWIFRYTAKPAVYLMRLPYYNTIVTTNESAIKEQTETETKPGWFKPTLKPTLYDYNKVETTYMWDKPPIFPDAAFVPLYGEKNKVLLNANFNVGEYDLEPLLIEGGEQTTINKIRMNQHKLEGKVTFKK